MIHHFKTRAEAKNHHYGHSFLNKKPNYDSKRCAFEVAVPGRITEFHQCTRKPGFGPDKLYCKFHDPAAEELRNKKAQDARDAEWKIKQDRWDRDEAVRTLCEGVSTDKLKELGTGWLRNILLKESPSRSPHCEYCE